jgi:hypothetical protein
MLLNTKTNCIRIVNIDLSCSICMRNVLDFEYIVTEPIRGFVRQAQSNPKFDFVSPVTKLND